ncbi:MAG TPA: ribonuclease P protein component [Geminicoccaceae bacterium]|nr:ribonuclease P protein component [Geminicoccaceae bacterium]
MVRLKRRREFLAVAGARCRWATAAFVLQAGPRDAAEEIGIGFTASRRIGNAVARNRARRRLRAAVRALLPGAARPGYDYVIVARPAILTCSFEALLTDLANAFARVIRQRPPGGARGAGAAAGPPARSRG